MLWCHSDAVFLIDECAVGDTQQGVVGAPHRGGLELHVVGRDQRHVVLIGEPDEARFRRRLRRQTMTLKLDVEPIAEDAAHLGEGGVTLGGASGGE